MKLDVSSIIYHMQLQMILTSVVSVTVQEMVYVKYEL